MRSILLIVVVLSIISCKKDIRSNAETHSDIEQALPPQEIIEEEASQEEINQALAGVFNDHISMEVDETVFVVDNGINKANEEMTAGIMKMLIPKQYEAFKKEVKEKPNSQEGLTTLEVKETELQGKKVFVERSMMIDQDGDKIIMLMHAIPVEDMTIMVSSYFKEKEESKYKPLIEASVISAKLNK